MSVQTTNPDFEQLLSYLKQSRGFDFSAYKRSTLMRRVQKRMQVLDIASFVDYMDFLEVHQDEFHHLFNTILINVTSFFRDEDAWDYLRDDIIPAILKNKEADSYIRIWVAGCASGEEACTVAMVVWDLIGADDFRERVKIYATDVDEEALQQSRTATYSEREVASVPEALRTRFFERVGDRYVFDREIRRSIIFGRHDLIQDAPISRVDLMVCRNTLMYFNAETQERILNRFHFALNEGGFLFLGKAETMLTHAQLFTPVDLKKRVFAKVQRGRGKERSHLFSVTNPENTSSALDHHVRLREAVLENTQDATVVIDANGRLYHANERARALFGLSVRDVGRPIEDLEISYRPIELRSGLDQAWASRRAVFHKDVNWQSPVGESLILDVKILPLQDETGRMLGVVTCFDDVTQFKRLQSELQNFNQELETAYEELQSTNEELQTTNEELQFTVEELETTNEELQSTNEELETMNEELHSTNEELEAINEELRERSEQLNEANAFLNSVLGGIRSGVVVLDREMQVIAWNAKSADQWGLSSEEVFSRHFLNLDIGFPVERIRSQVKACLADGTPQDVSVRAINRRGRKVNCEVTISQLEGHQNEARGVIILIEDSLSEDLS